MRMLLVPARTKKAGPTQIRNEQKNCNDIRKHVLYNEYDK
jgi:hypothetical protein